MNGVLETAVVIAGENGVAPWVLAAYAVKRGWRVNTSPEKKPVTAGQIAVPAVAEPRPVGGPSGCERGSGMTRPGALRITAPYNDGPREVEAYPTPVPGLLISPDAKVEGAWCVCHAASGLALADCPDPESALNIAVKLGELADWTKSTRGLRRDRHLRRACQAASRTGWRSASSGTQRCPTRTCARWKRARAVRHDPQARLQVHSVAPGARSRFSPTAKVRRAPSWPAVAGRASSWASTRRRGRGGPEIFAALHEAAALPVPIVLDRVGGDKFSHWFELGAAPSARAFCWDPHAGMTELQPPGHPAGRCAEGNRSTAMLLLAARDQPDVMPEVIFDDQFAIHRSVDGLSDTAFRLHVAAIFWSARNLMDGFVPEEDLDLVCARVRAPSRFAAECVSRGTWHEAPVACGSEKRPPSPADGRAG